MVFLLMRVIGDPIQAALGGRLSPEQIAERKAEAGLDRPILTQYWEYLSGLFRGDFGTTLTDNRKVSTILVENGAATLELAFWSLLVAFAIGIPLGRLAARYRDQLPDVLLRLFAILVYAAPVFFVGLLLKLAFSPFGWPSSGRASISTELTLQDVDPQTHIMIVDAFLWGDPGDDRRRAQARHAPGHRPRPADRWRVPPPRTRQPAADHAHGLRHRCPCSRGERAHASSTSTRSATPSSRSSP